MNFVDQHVCNKISWFIWLVLWCLTPFSTICMLLLGGQFYWRRNPGKSSTCRKSL